MMVLIRGLCHECYASNVEVTRNPDKGTNECKSCVRRRLQHV